MPDLDENLPDDEVQTELDQPAEAAELDQPTELPEDPEALKQTAAQLQADLLKANQDKRAAEREAERQKENAKEQKTKADWLSRQNLRLEKQVDSHAPALPGNGALAAETALKGLDLAEYVAMDDGVEKLIGELEARGAIMTPAMARQMIADEKAQQRSEGQVYRQVISRYKDLEDPESELATEAASIFEEIVEENPGLNNATGFELAAARAAAKIGYTAKPKPTADRRPPTGNDRIRRAQGGPTPAGGGRSNPPVAVDDKLRKMATKTFGTQVDDAVLKRVAQRVSANQKRAS